MIELTGSPKQIAWATDLRTYVLHDLDRGLSEYQRVLGSRSETRAIADLGAEALRRVLELRPTRWWIDICRRSGPGATFAAINTVAGEIVYDGQVAVS